ncbi:hypothetical protein Q1695_005364 [Nippostrongylus brasiliensis]|nr:hypothetical protein Q1695_005364 [Nippostrongylus brasiliensis]
MSFLSCSRFRNLGGLRFGSLLPQHPTRIEMVMRAILFAFFIPIALTYLEPDGEDIITQQGLPCEFSCTERATYSVRLPEVQGQESSIHCGNNNTLGCSECCKLRAFVGGIDSNFVAGFSTENRCICCFLSQLICPK